MGSLGVYPLLTERAVDAGVSVGLISLTAVPPHHAGLRVVAVASDARATWRLPAVELRFGDDAPLRPQHAGGGGSDTWMRWDVTFIGRVPDPPEMVHVSLLDSGSSSQPIGVSVPPLRPIQREVTYEAVDDVEGAITQDHRLVLPRTIRAVRRPVEGPDGHLVVSVEHWERTSVVLVYAAGERRQAPELPAWARATDDRGRTYDVRTDGGGTWCAGAAAHLRLTPAVPDDVERLHLQSADSRSSYDAVTLPVR